MTEENNTLNCQELYYPNKFGRIIIQALEDVMGRNGLNAVLHLAGLEHYIYNRPPNNLEKEFSFAELTNLQKVLEDMYGPRGGRGLAIRAGRATFDRGLKGVGALVGVGDLAFRVLPLNTKMKIGLPALARIFSQFSDQISNVRDEGDHFVYTLEQCPMCCNRKTDHPICFFGLGLLQEALSWVSGGNTFKVDIQSCQAKGDEMGRYIISKRPIT
ncbi:MAG: 4-vinyl reductase [Chloroflexi bacterium]|nr:4-vinyl reductase [Chloroflexota bacterium]